MKVQVRRDDKSKSNEVLVLADTGCTDNCISEEIAKRCKLEIESTDERMKVAHGRSLELIGRTEFIVSYQGYSLKIRAMILRNLNNKCYLSEQTLKDFGILNVEFPNIPKDGILTLSPSPYRYPDPHSRNNNELNSAQFIEQL